MKYTILFLIGTVIIIGSLSSCSMHNSIHLIKAPPSQEIISPKEQHISDNIEEDKTINNFPKQGDKLIYADSTSSFSLNTKIIQIRHLRSGNNSEIEQSAHSNHKVYDNIVSISNQDTTCKPARKESNDTHWSLSVIASILGVLLGMITGMLVVIGLFLGVYDGSLPDTDDLKDSKDFYSVFKRAFSITIYIVFWIGILAIIAMGIYWLYLQYGLLLTLLGVGGIIILFSLIALWFNRNSDGLMRFLFIGW